MSAPVVVRCPSCDRRVRYEPGSHPVERARVRCGGCGARFVIRRRSGDAGTPDPETGPAAAAAAASDAGQPTERITPRGQGTWSLEPGTLLAGRFRLIRPLGRGGMGEVFEAHDLELGERVALKTIRSDLTGESISLQRFRREVQMARRVTHRNVCRIFDVFRHQPESEGAEGPDGPDGDAEVVFLTMELLSGETLDRRLAREGALPLDEVLGIARQVASALDAAHRAGVVHRDLKSGNVILAPEPGGGVRAVVTDFGLARPQVVGEETAAALTVGQAALGTPDYMAPEQVSGDEVTSAADVYAFGITLYEMVAGRRPFLGDSPLTTAVKRLREPPPPPSTFRPDLDGRWEAAILRCLERRPGDRFERAGDVVRVLAGDAPAQDGASDARPAGAGDDAGGDRAAEAPAGGPGADAAPPEPVSKSEAGTPRRGRSRRERLKLVALSLVILASFAIALYRYLEWEPAGETVRQVVGLPSGESALRPSVALLGLADLTGDEETAWLSTAIPEMLRAELRSGESLRVLDGATVARLAPDLAADPAAEGLDRESLQRLRRGLGSEYVVSGSYLTLGESSERRIRLDLNVYDAGAGERIASFSERAPEDGLFDLVAASGEALRDALGVAAAEDAARDVRAALPATPEAARLYAEGLAHLQSFEPLAARELLQQAAALEPTNPLIHSALSLVWTDMGYQDRAREAARKAMDLGDDLPREERLILEARLFEATGRWDRAAEAYRNLWALYPDNLEHGLRLAECQTRSGQAAQAMTVVAALRTFPEPLGQDPRIDLAEARAASSIGAFQRQQAAAERGAERAAEQGSSLLVAQARLMACEALRHLGHPERARSACEEAEEIYARHGDRGGEAAALVGLGSVLYDLGELAAARERLEEALAVNRSMGNQGGAAAVLNNLAVVMRNQGEADRALELYEQALQASHEIGSQAGEAHARSNMAGLFVQQGRLGRARELAEQSLDLFRSMGDRGGEATALDHLGSVARLAGDLPRAREHHRRALSIRREIGQRRGEAATLKNLGRVGLDGGDLESAREHFGEALEVARTSGHPDLAASALEGLGRVAYEEGAFDAARERLDEALRIREEVGQAGAAAESRIGLARVALASDRPDRAMELARRAAEELGVQGMEDDRAVALALVAASLRTLDRPDEAREALDRAREVAAATESRSASLTVAIEGARIGWSAEETAAEEALEAARSLAESLGLAGLALEARLARLEAGAFRPDEAAALAEEAEAAGYGRIARRARDLARDLAREQARELGGTA